MFVPEDDMTICGDVTRLLHKIQKVFYKPEDVPFDNGIYFFYKGMFYCNNHLPGPFFRILRVGTHRKDNNLRHRLKLHYTGNKNSSVFRRLIGSAILREAKMERCYDHWEKQGKKTCPLCKQVEETVTSYIKEHYFKCIEVKDRDLRLRLEEGLIAMLSSCPKCNSPDFEDWLGEYCYAEEVKKSRLWNIKGVNAEPLTGEEFGILSEIVMETKEKYDM